MRVQKTRKRESNGLIDVDSLGISCMKLFTKNHEFIPNSLYDEREFDKDYVS